MSSDREAQLTLPQAVRAALTGTTPKGVDELSRELGISEKALPELIEKVARSLQRGEQRLHREPPRCVACGYEFEDRTRARRPSRCPRCSSERLTRARFWIQ